MTQVITVSSLYVYDSSHCIVSSLYVYDSSHCTVSSLYVYDSSHCTVSSLYVYDSSHCTVSSLYVCRHCTVSSLYVYVSSHCIVNSLYVYVSSHCIVYVSSYLMAMYINYPNSYSKIRTGLLQLPLEELDSKIWLHSTVLDSSIPLFWEVPFHYIGELHSSILSDSIPLFWTAPFHYFGLHSTIFNDVQSIFLSDKLFVK